MYENHNEPRDIFCDGDHEYVPIFVSDNSYNEDLFKGYEPFGDETWDQ